MDDGTTLKIKCGSQVSTHTLKKGVNFVAVPLSEGQPQFMVNRKGRVIIDRMGEFVISDDNAWAEFNDHSGSGEK